MARVAPLRSALPARSDRLHDRHRQYAPYGSTSTITPSSAHA
jgi:hypothetical protein